MVVKLQGGLGNQLFQAAYGMTLGAKFDRSGIVPPREYALEPFNLPIEFDGPATQVGYWQGEKYFDPALAKKAFSQPNKPAPFPRACAIHIRLTDNLSERALAYHGNLLDTDYYERAIAYIRNWVPKPEFVIFSDDIEWCKKNFDPRDFIFAFGNEPHEDIWLMARCPYAIIANSSFSWWGAWLGKQKMVVAPKRWFVTPNVPEDCKDIVPDRWMKL